MGERGVIVKIYGNGGFRKRIVEMGFIKGKTVEAIMNAPLKDPIIYKIIGYKVSLRREEAKMIEVISESEVEEQTKNRATNRNLRPNFRHRNTSTANGTSCSRKRKNNKSGIGRESQLRQNFAF